MIVVSADLERIEPYEKKITSEITSPETTCVNELSGKFGKDISALNNKFLQRKPVEFLERLLTQPSAVEFESRKFKMELNELLMASTALERNEMENFKSIKSHVQEYCPYGTKEECFRNHYNKNILHKKCDKIHFKRILKPHTDILLGDCSFLNTCYNINNCKVNFMNLK